MTRSFRPADATDELARHEARDSAVQWFNGSEAGHDVGEQDGGDQECEGVIDDEQQEAVTPKDDIDDEQQECEGDHEEVIPHGASPSSA